MQLRKFGKQAVLADNNSCFFLSCKILCSLIFVLVASLTTFGQSKELQVTLTASETQIMTKTIQHAIDSCAAKGGGIVYFSDGTYLSGTINMKSKVTLHLQKNAVLKGSSKYADYSNDAFIYGDSLYNIGFTGEGSIDGVDCTNTSGEEGFRGPHCIKLINCTDISFKSITIINSANWAINCRFCTNGSVEKVTILGGHDGLHTRFCKNFTVTGCNFQTGDDCFAGNDNENFVVTDCRVNTSCNAFRIGCLNLLVKHCRIWGPGVYAHKIENAKRMPTAFVHFSPDDENTRIPSGKWLIQDVTIDSADYVYVYNFENGLWQTGHPATSVRFENVRAKGLLKAFYIIGDKERQFNLRVSNSSFSYRDGGPIADAIFENAKIKSTAFFYAEKFGKVELQNVTLKNAGKGLLVDCKSGNELILKKIKKPGAAAVPYLFTGIKKVITN